MVTGITLKAAGMVIKTLSLPLVALFFMPIYDWTLLQVVDDYSLLTPLEKAFFNDLKVILGPLVLVLTVIKLILGSIKIKKDITVKKEATNEEKEVK